jgi:hypothetical protein
MNNIENTPENDGNNPEGQQVHVKYQLSSNSTLFWRVFIPAFGTVFMTGLVLGHWLTDAETLYISALWFMSIRVFVTLLWALWIFFVWRTLWRFKRIDADEQHFYVTNYWKTLRYPWSDLERIEEKRRLGRRVVNFYLKSPGSFGQKLSFLPGSDFGPWKVKHSIK